MERKYPSIIVGKSRDDDEASGLFREWEQSFAMPDIKVGDGENFNDLKQQAVEMLVLRIIYWS